MPRDAPVWDLLHALTIFLTNKVFSGSNVYDAEDMHLVIF